MTTDSFHSGFFIEKKIRMPSFGMNYEHSHNYCELFYLKSGACMYTVNGRRFHLSGGELFIVKAHDIHSTRYEGSEPSERIVVAFDHTLLPEGFLDSHNDLLITLASTVKVILGDLARRSLESILNRMLEETTTPDEYTSDFMMLHTMSLLMTIQRSGVFVRDNPDRLEEVSPCIEEAINYIALNYSLPITLEDMAARFGLCPSYFSKKFKLQTGRNFKEYLNYIRLRQAEQMLLTTDDSVTKIAFNCGFNSSNYFKDCFRKKYRTSPRSFRASRSQ